MQDLSSKGWIVLTEIFLTLKFQIFYSLIPPLYMSLHISLQISYKNAEKKCTSDKFEKSHLNFAWYCMGILRRSYKLITFRS